MALNWFVAELDQFINKMSDHSRHLKLEKSTKLDFGKELNGETTFVRN